MSDTSSAPIPEGMVRLTHALVETPSLREWFYRLESLSLALRNAAFSQMAGEMRSEGEGAELTSAVALLARPGMYETVLAATRERVKEVDHRK